MKKYNKKISFSKLLFSFSIILVLLSLEILYAVIIKNYRSTLEETASDMSWAVTGTITTQLSYYTNEIYNILSEINQTIATTGLNEGWKLIEEQNNIREDLLTVWFCNEDGNYWKIENGAVVTYNDTDMLSIDLSRLSTAAKNHLCIGSTNGSYNINFPFKTKEEKDLFLKLIEVKGLGCKMALPMFAMGDVNNIISAIEQENINYLKKSLNGSIK